MGSQRIVCLTEATTEWLYLLGQQDRIVGISDYIVRPRRAWQGRSRPSTCCACGDVDVRARL